MVRIVSHTHEHTEYNVLISTARCVSSGELNWQQWCTFLSVFHTRCLTVRLVDIPNAQEPTIPGLRRGIPGSGDGLPNQMTFDTEKTKHVLEVKWTSMEETAKELIDD